LRSRESRQAVPGEGSCATVSTRAWKALRSDSAEKIGSGPAPRNSLRGPKAAPLKHAR